MATNTPRLALRKPGGGDNVTVLTDLDNNYDILDNAIVRDAATNQVRHTGDLFAQYGTVNQVRLGSVGVAVAAGIEFGSAANFMGVIAVNRVGLFLNSVKTVDFQTTMAQFLTPVVVPQMAAAAVTAPPPSGGAIFQDSVTGGLRWKDQAGNLHSVTFTTP